MPSYHLPDEPSPGPLARLAVRPLWPLLAIMAAGPWLSWPWYVLNAHAVGSPSRWRETLIAIGGLAGSVALVVAVYAGEILGLLDTRTEIRLALLVVVLWKLAVTYWLMILQEPAVDLFEYYRGVVRNGVWIVVAGFFLDSRLNARLPIELLLVID